MSGGHWDYNQDRIQEVLEKVGKEWDVHERFPNTAKSFRNLAEVLSAIIGEIDWDLSGDTVIENDKSFDQKCIEKIRKCLPSIKE